MGIGSLLLLFITRPQDQISFLTINDNKLSIQIATTSQEKQQGLCCRDSLPENQAMLFVYDEPGNYRFWMKNTKIPLDMYWINSQKKIVHIEEAVLPSTYPMTFGTNAPAQYILETNANYASKNHIKVGDNVSF